MFNREFTVAAPVRVTDITYVRTWQGRQHPGVVIDLHSRKAIGWSMKPSLARSAARRAHDGARAAQAARGRDRSFRPRSAGGDDGRWICRWHHLSPSMGRRDACWDNGVANAFLSSLEEGAYSQTCVQNPEISPGPMSSTASKRSTAPSVVTATCAGQPRGL